MVGCLGTKEEADESLSIWVREQTNMVDIVVSAWNRSLHQEEGVGKTFFR